MKPAPPDFGMMSAPLARLWIAGIAALLACAGCGFKGPLYLPKHNGTVVTRTGQAAQPAPSGTQAPTSATQGKGKTSSSPPAASQPSSAPSAPQNSALPQSPPP